MPPGHPWPPHRPHAPSCSSLLPTLTGAGCWHSLLLHPLPLTAVALDVSFYPSALRLNVISKGGEVTTPRASKPLPAATSSLLRPVRLLLGVREVKPTWQRQSHLCAGPWMPKMRFLTSLMSGSAAGLTSVAEDQHTVCIDLLAL